MTEGRWDDVASYTEFMGHTRPWYSVRDAAGTPLGSSQPPVPQWTRPVRPQPGPSLGAVTTIEATPSSQLDLDRVTRAAMQSSLTLCAHRELLAPVGSGLKPAACRRGALASVS